MREGGCAASRVVRIKEKRRPATRNCGSPGRSDLSRVGSRSHARRQSGGIHLVRITQSCNDSMGCGSKRGQPTPETPPSHRCQHRQ